MTAALGFAGISPLLVGPVILTRFDLWPAALTAGALACLVAGRPRLGHAVIGLGFVAKLYPALLLPLAVAFVWKRRGRREALVCLGIFAAVAVACFLPFFVLSPRGVWHGVAEQGSRPLQLESLGAAVLLALHHLFGLGVTMVSSHGSQNLGGRLAAVVAYFQSILQIAAVVGTWVWYARGEPGRERLVRAAALAVVAYIALGKVLSPQYLIWLIPLVPLVWGRRGLWASGLFAFACVLTQTYFPYRSGSSPCTSTPLRHGRFSSATLCSSHCSPCLPGRDDSEPCLLEGDYEPRDLTVPRGEVIRPARVPSAFHA